MKKYSLEEIDLLRKYVRLTHNYQGQDDTEEVVRTIMTSSNTMKELLKETKKILKAKEKELEDERKLLREHYKGHVKLSYRYVHTDCYGGEDEEKEEYDFVEYNNLDEEKLRIKKDVRDDRKDWNETVKSISWKTQKITKEDIDSRLSDYAKRKIEDLRKLSQDINKLVKK